MKQQITFEIECGEKTCASSKGSFCQFFRPSLGRDGSCHLFGPVYDDGSGWVQRHRDCMPAEVTLDERQPQSVESLIDALQSPVHRDVGRSRSAKAARA